MPLLADGNDKDDAGDPRAHRRAEVTVALRGSTSIDAVNVQLETYLQSPRSARKHRTAHKTARDAIYATNEHERTSSSKEKRSTHDDELEALIDLTSNFQEIISCRKTRAGTSGFCAAACVSSALELLPLVRPAIAAIAAIAVIAAIAAAATIVISCDVGIIVPNGAI